MEWNVYYYDFNGRIIKVYNALSGMEQFIKKQKKKCNSKDEFSEKLKSEMMCRYWSKCEWEIVLSAWCGGDGSESKKIDVYDQIFMNWEKFVDYCWMFHHKYQRRKENTTENEKVRKNLV